MLMFYLTDSVIACRIDDVHVQCCAGCSRCTGTTVIHQKRCKIFLKDFHIFYCIFTIHHSPFRIHIPEEKFTFWYNIHISFYFLYERHAQHKEKKKKKIKQAQAQAQAPTNMPYTKYKNEFLLLKYYHHVPNTNHIQLRLIVWNPWVAIVQSKMATNWHDSYRFTQ